MAQKSPPVDIISFGSPCQDLSVAGQGAGLDGARSGLFLEAVRIIYEMREATNGSSPTYIIWENVPGAFSSHGGDDFRRVLQEIAKTTIPMPKLGRWAPSGMVRTKQIGIAWRTFDAQYWGVPQQRKRIYLVGNFGNRCAEEILGKSLITDTEKRFISHTEIITPHPNPAIGCLINCHFTSFQKKRVSAIFGTN